MSATLPGASQAESPFQAYDNYDLTGDEYRRLESLDVSACSQSCTSESQCQAFVFDKWTRQCSLKKSVAASRFDPGVIAGLRQASSFPSITAEPLVMQRQLGLSLSGTGVDEPTATSLDACESLCRSQQDCVAVTYQKSCTRFQSVEQRSANGEARSSIKRQRTTADAAAESEFWEYVKHQNKPDYYQEYLAVFPSGSFAQAAQDQIAALKGRAALRSDNVEFRDRFPSPWIVQLDKRVRVWDRPASNAEGAGTIAAGRQILILGGVGDGSWYRILDRRATRYGSSSKFIPRAAIEAANPIAGGPEPTRRLQRSVALFDSDASQREAALQSVKHGAVGQAGTVFWFRWNASDAESAKTGILNTCSSSKCQVVVTLRSPQCFALYRKKPNGWGWAVRNDINTALSAARDSCIQRNKSCEKSASFCADGSNVFNIR
ncbi:MAG: DUF4189 domain-containing protein [Xanthobacteraceae bacterium]|nr:DUF4189 domain-containing protein [Xanthobacteraceae bacterium]